MDNTINVHEVGKPLPNDDTSFFGEWVFFENPEEFEEANEYLKLWKKFFLKKIPSLEQVGKDYMITKHDINDTGKSSLGIKIEVRNKD